MDDAATEDKAEQPEDKALSRRRYGRRKITERALGDPFVEMPSKRHILCNGTTGAEPRLRLPQALQPDDVVLFLRATLTNELVTICLQPIDPGGLGQAVLRAIGFESCDHRGQLVDRAAETLAILLQEFRHLGGSEAEQERGEKSEAAQDHGERSERARRLI